MVWAGRLSRYIYVSITHEVGKEAVCGLGWQTLKIYICKHDSRGS